MQQITYEEYRDILLDCIAKDDRVRINCTVPEHYEGNRYYKSDQGISYLSKNGFMGGLCRFKEGGENVADLHQRQRIKDGGYFLECFEGKLSNLHTERGFKVVGVLPFDPEQAAEGWEAVIPNRPNVVFMSLYSKQLKRSIDYVKLYEYAASIHNFKVAWSRSQMDKIIEDFHSLGSALKFCGKTEDDIKVIVEHEWGEAVYGVEDPMNLYITRTNLTKSVN